MIYILKFLLTFYGASDNINSHQETMEVVGILDSVNIVKRPFISTYIYHFNKCKIRHMQRTAPYELGLPGNCHLDIGSEYSLSLILVNEKDLLSSSSLYAYLPSRNDFEASLNELLSDQILLRKLLEKPDFRDDYLEIDGKVFLTKNISPCSAQESRSHKNH